MTSQTAPAGPVALRYSPVAQVLHWITATLILLNLLLGWRMGLMHGLAKFQVFQLHKSFGISVLVLSLVRLAWRLLHRPPPHEGLRPAERAVAHGVHLAFYGLMICLPFSGWLLVSTSSENIPTLLYRVLPWPYVPGIHGLPAPARHQVGWAAGVVHYWLAWSAVALVVLHVAGALKHQFGAEAAVLPRMLPPVRSRRLAPVVAAAVILVPACGAIVLAAGAVLQASRVVSVPLAAPTTTAAAETNWLVDRRASSLGFAATVNGEAITGHFEHWTASILFDPDRLGEAKVDVSIDTGSARTGDDTRDQMLPTSDWFDHALFPQARFRTSRIVRIGGNRYEADGVLTIRSADKPAHLPFTLDIENGVAHMSAALPIDRTSFGVGQGQFAGTDSVAATVTVQVRLVAHARPAS